MKLFPATLAASVIILLAAVPANSSSSHRSTSVRLSVSHDETGTRLTSPMRLRLPSITTHSYQARRSRDGTSVTLAYPRSRPCSTTTVRLSLLAGDDALQKVRDLQTQATEEGQVATTSRGDSQLLRTDATPSAAWRSLDSIVNNTKFVFSSRSVSAVTVHSGGGSRRVLRVLSVTGRSTKVGTFCAGASHFSVGAAVMELASAIAR